MIITLLRRNISKWQLGAYGVACLTGLSILLVSLCFYADLRSAQSTENAASDYIVLSKPGSVLSIIGGSTSTANSFSGAEIEDLKRQPWAKRVGEFTSADFNISASVEFAGRGLSTALFFESLPDEFIDIDLTDFRFEPSQGEIPVLVPRDYLALYNYGFAASRGMPQLSEEIIRQVPIQIAVYGNGHYDIFPARIAGLSSRLNTIAVPESFMSWANERYGKATSERKPSRLIVELSSPGDPAIAEWLEENNIESSDDQLISDRTIYLAGLAATVVGAIGAVIAALAVMILLLSLFLLIQKNSDKIRDLTLLGYTRRQVGKFYYRLVIIINSTVTIGAIEVALIVSRIWQDALSSFGATGNSYVLVIASAIIIMAIVTAISVMACSKMIKRASR
ncbi:MAG: ABC transporter permease [Muribaculaceae bacterium]|nr:ABC transporter permease [Muribaculaceae bacterium]